MKKIGHVVGWMPVGLVGVLLMTVGTMSVMKAQTGGCPNLKGVEGGWGLWRGDRG